MSTANVPCVEPGKNTRFVPFDKGTGLSSQKLVSQSFSAFSATTSEYFSAVSGSHSLHEAVLFFALKFLRLICSFHSCKPPLLRK